MADLRTQLQVPKNTPVVDSSGQMTLEWQKYITQLQKTISAAQEALELIYMTRAGTGGDVVHGGSQLLTGFSVPLVQTPGVLTQGPLGEASVVITYVNSVSGTGVSFTTKTVSFTNGIEVSHT